MTAFEDANRAITRHIETDKHAARVEQIRKAA
jgi:hypothetical protein